MSEVAYVMKKANFIEKSSVFFHIKKMIFLIFFEVFQVPFEFFITKRWLKLFFEIYNFVELDELYRTM